MNSPRADTREQNVRLNGSSSHQTQKKLTSVECAFEGFVKKILRIPQWPPNSEILYYKSRFAFKPSINLGVIATKLHS